MPLAQQYTTSVRPNLNCPTNSSAVWGIPHSRCSSPIRRATDRTRSMLWEERDRSERRSGASLYRWGVNRTFTFSKFLLQSAAPLGELL